MMIIASHIFAILQFVLQWMLPHLLGQLRLTANDLKSSALKHLSFHYRKVCSALDSDEAPVLSGSAVYHFFVVSSSHNRRKFSALLYLFVVVSLLL